jgi:capsular polysaccharide biosynthesis protein
MKVNPAANVRFPIGIFFWVFVFVSTLVFGISVVATSLGPKAYASAARVEVKYKPAEGKQTRSEKRFFDPSLAKTESEVINSEVVMTKAIGNLNLNVVWGKKYYNDETRKTWESLKILKGRTIIRPVPDTTLIEIRVYDDNPDDAATTANGIAKAYTSYVATNDNNLQAQIIDSAYATNTPVRPNKALNYFWGIVTGFLLGLLAGAGIALIVFLKNRKANKIFES